MTLPSQLDGTAPKSEGPGWSRAASDQRGHPTARPPLPRADRDVHTHAGPRTAHAANDCPPSSAPAPTHRRGKGAECQESSSRHLLDPAVRLYEIGSHRAGPDFHLRAVRVLHPCGSRHADGPIQLVAYGFLLGVARSEEN